MALDPEFLAILACPIGKKPLRHENDRLVCTHCGATYRIEDEIPIMLIDECELPAGVEHIRDLICWQVPEAGELPEEYKN